MAELDGFEAMLTALRAVGERVVAATPDGLGNAAAHLEAEVKALLSSTSHPAGTPTPSPPGSPPSLVSGNLRRSIQVEGPSQTGAGRWSVSVGSGLVYAGVQEHGGGNNLPARPYMAPGLATAIPGMQAYMEAAWASALTT